MSQDFFNSKNPHAYFLANSLREKCPDTEFFLVRIFPQSNWYLPVFTPSTGKYGPGKTPYLDTFHTVTFEGVLSAQSRPYQFKFFKSCLAEILLGTFLNILSHM